MRMAVRTWPADAGCLGSVRPSERLALEPSLRVSPGCVVNASISLLALTGLRGRRARFMTRLAARGGRDAGSV